MRYKSLVNTYSILIAWSYIRAFIFCVCVERVGWDSIQLQLRVDDWHLVHGNTMYELSADFILLYMIYVFGGFEFVAITPKSQL